MTTIPQALSLAIEHHQAGRLDVAEQIYCQILQVEPNHAEAIHLLGVLAHQVGKHEIAAQHLERAIGLNGTEAAFHSNLGEAYRALRRIPEAVACYRRALELKPDFAEAHNNLGNALTAQGKLNEAVDYCRRALNLKPDYAEAHNNLGNALTDQGKLDEAVACYRRSLELKPDFAEAYNNLGGAWKDQGKLDEAVACCRRALELKPDLTEAYNSLGLALKDQGKLDEAIACYRQALQRKPDYAIAHSNLLLTLQYCPGVTLAALAAAHADYDGQYAELLRGDIPLPAVRRNRHAPLRVGFVSPDLARHPVGYFLVRVLENLDHAQMETICYSDRVIKDDLTVRLQAAANQWRDTVGTSDQQLAEQIRADRIDVLFDLAGHTAHNRLLVFARQPAPIQITWAGYVGTTGLTAMDYLLADAYHVPPSAGRFYQERILRMPDGYVCYDPPDYAPLASPLSALDRGAVTFGCFNNPAKVTPQAIEVWAAILRRLPRSRLVFKYRGWDDSGVSQPFAEMFLARGIEPDRLEFLGHSPHAELLAEYNRIDLALDPFPYSGGLTTCEALWMGVPVITCPGETFASRHSLSHLSNIGLTETIARDLNEYVELAVSLASDLPRLALLRAGLRSRMAASPLCDGKRFADNLTNVLLGLTGIETLPSDRPSIASQRPAAAALRGSDRVNGMRLLLIDPIPWDYNVESVYQQPLGGSQSALCYVSEALARRGHQVSLLSNTTQPGFHRGVQCLALSTATPEDIQSLRADVCIVLNGVVDPARLRGMLGAAPSFVLWTQHDTDQAAVAELANPAVCAGYDRFVFVSDWQRSRYLAKFPIKPATAVVRPNAIAPFFAGLFPPGASIGVAKSRPPVLAYTSTPFRGLDVLLQVFPEIRQAVPGTRLKVFSSMQVYQVPEEADSQAFGDLYRQCRETEGVEYCGSLPQRQLAGELRHVAALAYPNTFPETSCIAVMEALAAGCQVITSDLGALPETTAGFAQLFSWEDGMPAYVERFRDAVIAFLHRRLDDSDSALEDQLRRQVDFAAANYTWTKRAEEWERWLSRG